MIFDHDEGELAASYYVLYSQLAANADSNSSGADNADDISVAPEPAATSTTVEGGGDDQEYWVEDEWTEERIEQAREELERSKALCDIESSSARGAFLIQRYEQDAGKNWDEFYSRHNTNFFKDRHYLHKTFPDEFGPLYDESCSHAQTSKTAELANGDDFTVMEIGCGVGNTVLPLLERGDTAIISGETKRICVWGLDFASVAIDLLKKDQRYTNAAKMGRASAGVWDITLPPPEQYGIECISNVSILLFCLSAISPDKMPDAARHAASTLKPDGTLVLRDYGRFDEAQMKLGTSRCKRLGENFYVKSDGTRCFYFELEDLRRLFGEEGAGLEVLELKYLRRTYQNKSHGVRRRVWVQGRFKKPE